MPTIQTCIINSSHVNIPNEMKELDKAEPLGGPDSRLYNIRYILYEGNAGQGTLFILHFSYTRQTQSASRRNIIH